MRVPNAGQARQTAGSPWQGLCASERSGDDEGDREIRSLGVKAKAGSHLPDPGMVKQVEGRIPQERHHRRSLPEMHEACVFAKGDIFVAMEVILDRPVAAPEREQVGGTGDVG